jgi:hypothetical protein
VRQVCGISALRASVPVFFALQHQDVVEHVTTTSSLQVQHVLAVLGPAWAADDGLHARQVPQRVVLLDDLQRQGLEENPAQLHQSITGVLDGLVIRRCDVPWKCSLTQRLAQGPQPRHDDLQPLVLQGAHGLVVADPLA